MHPKKETKNIPSTNAKEQHFSERVVQGTDFLFQNRWIAVGLLPLLTGISIQLANLPLDETAMNGTMVPAMYSITGMLYRIFREMGKTANPEND